MGFNRIGSLVDAIDAGQMRTYGWRKSFVATTPTNAWMDASMVPGGPVPNYYASAPLVAATLNGAEGIFHGANVSPATKYLKRLTAAYGGVTASPLNMILCDYLLYYPFIDESTNDVQALDNTVVLPRYTDGEGVQAMAVCVAAGAGLSAATGQITYTNSAGVSGRLSGQFVLGTVGPQALTQLLNAASGAGSVANAYGPFIPLQSGDKGIRSIDSFQITAGADVGLLTLVLVKPLASFQLREFTAPVEKDFLTDCPSLPVIKEGAYLNFLIDTQTQISASVLLGLIEIVWG